MRASSFVIDSTALGGKPSALRCRQLFTTANRKGGTFFLSCHFMPLVLELEVPRLQGPVDFLMVGLVRSFCFNGLCRLFKLFRCGCTFGARLTHLLAAAGLDAFLLCVDVCVESWFSCHDSSLKYGCDAADTFYYFG